jgi:plastocyanin
MFAAAAALMWAGIVSCFSERATGSETGTKSCTAQLPSTAFGTTIVVIQNFAFVPAEVHVRAGTKVTWVNCDAPTPHTTTADGGAWSSELLDPGATVTVDFPTVGTFPYHCVPHPFMTGRVVVE